MTNEKTLTATEIRQPALQRLSLEVKKEILDEAKVEIPEITEEQREKEEKVKLLAQKIKDKRIGNEKPYDYDFIDSMLSERGIIPGTPKADEFMQKWDLEEADEEYEKKSKEIREWLDKYLISKENGWDLESVFEDFEEFLKDKELFLPYGLELNKERVDEWFSEKMTERIIEIKKHQEREKRISPFLSSEEQKDKDFILKVINKINGWNIADEKSGRDSFKEDSQIIEAIRQVKKEIIISEESIEGEKKLFDNMYKIINSIYPLITQKNAEEIYYQKINEIKAEVEEKKIKVELGIREVEKIKEKIEKLPNVKKTPVKELLEEGKEEVLPTEKIPKEEIKEEEIRKSEGYIGLKNLYETGGQTIETLQNIARDNYENMGSAAEQLLKDLEKVENFVKYFIKNKISINQIQDWKPEKEEDIELMREAKTKTIKILEEEIKNINEKYDQKIAPLKIQLAEEKKELENSEKKLETLKERLAKLMEKSKEDLSKKTEKEIFERYAELMRRYNKLLNKCSENFGKSMTANENIEFERLDKALKSNFGPVGHLEGVGIELNALDGETSSRVEKIIEQNYGKYRKECKFDELYSQNMETHLAFNNLKAVLKNRLTKMYDKKKLAKKEYYEARENLMKTAGLFENLLIKNKASQDIKRITKQWRSK